MKGYQVLLVGINNENEFFFRWMEWSTSTPIEFCFVLKENLICFRSFLGTIIRQKVKHQRPDGWKTSRKVIIVGKKIESSLNMEIITEKMFSDFSRNAKHKIFFFSLGVLLHSEEDCRNYLQTCHEHTTSQQIKMVE